MLEAESLEVQVLRKHLRAANVSFDPNGSIHLPSWCRSVKIDAGLSFNAKMSFEWLERQPEDLVVFAFEPVQSNIQQIQAKMQAHPDPEWLYQRLILLPIALGKEFGKREFFVTHDTGQSSLLRPTKATIELVQIVEVVTLQAFNSLISLEDMPFIDYLKTDCQGTDLDILRGAGSSITRYVCITSESETANYQGSQNSLRHTKNFLSGYGFTQVNSRNTIRVLVGDFIKRFDWLHALVSTLYRKSVGQKNIRPGLTIEVEDPTYVNTDVLVHLSDRTVSAFQRG
jgi:FkbM family methyltransferase